LSARNFFSKLPWVLPCVVLSACSTVQQVESDPTAGALSYQTRFERLSAIDNWSLEGRLAISNDDDGGSGHFSWKKRIFSDRMDFHGALGRGAWRLEADENGAVLEMSDGRVYQAGSVGDLVSNRIGWDIPVDQLAWWVRGLAAPGESGHRILGEEGKLIELQQTGWTIEFSAYRAFDGIELPVKLTAQRADSRVKLAIKRWEMSDEAESGG
jgi:outer membrane lipoprotein LolB